MTRSLLLFVVGASLIALFGCEVQKKIVWHEEGRADAKQDLAAGKLQLRTYGLVSPWAGKYRRMVHDKYGVEFVVVAGCLVNDELIERAAGYNEVMQREIDRRYGPGALEKLAHEARDEYQKEQKAEKEAEQQAKP